MPRLSPSTITQARSRSPLLAALLPATRDLAAATNELRWLREHVTNVHPRSSSRFRTEALARACRLRGSGYPLQYLLGSQPFGRLDILCRPGVLIPRSDTEGYTFHLAELIRRRQAPLDLSSKVSILDVCSGTGCIGLGLFSALHDRIPRLRVQGIDINPEAIALSRRNLQHNIKSGVIPNPQPQQSVTFTRHDIFSSDALPLSSPPDILISNPPYISSNTYSFGRGQLSRSVKRHEPKLALVPDVSSSSQSVPPSTRWSDEDVFYARLVSLARAWKPKVALFEVGGEEQARRVLEVVVADKLLEGWDPVVWRDWPGDSSSSNSDFLELEGTGKQTKVQIKGSGNIRAVCFVGSVGI